jgi:hypothetical protein
MKNQTKPQTWTDYLDKRPKRRNGLVLAHDRNRWRALVNSVLNLQVQ